MSGKRAALRSGSDHAPVSPADVSAFALTPGCDSVTIVRSGPIRRPPVAHKFEIYKDKASVQNAIDSIKKNGPGAETEDNS